jgi:pentatricopeptide repeat protein
MAMAMSIRGFASMRPYQSRFIHRHSRTLLYIMHLRDWDPSLERELSASGAILTHNIVDQVMGCIPSPRLALQFFIWSGEQIGFPRPSSPSNYDILRWYARKSQTLVFLNILRSLGRPQLCLSPSKINVLIQGYGWAGMLDRSFKLLADCRGFGNAFLVNCFLYSVIKERRYDLVHDVYAEMKKCRLDPPMACIEKLVYGFSRAGGVRNWSEADELFDGIVRSGQVPSPEICNAFAVATSQLGKQNRALELFVYMKEHGIVPEKATFGALVECLCRCKQIQKASKLIEEMNQFGYSMDIKIYKTLLGAL